MTRVRRRNYPAPGSLKVAREGYQYGRKGGPAKATEKREKKGKRE